MPRRKLTWKRVTFARRRTRRRRNKVEEEKQVEEEVEPTQVKDYDVNRVGLII